MFTGLISAVGRVRELSHTGTPRLVVETSLAKALKTGESIAVNGVCLTALDITDSSFAADLAEETVARTNLKNLMPGVRVNLELPARADSRLDGHVVQGHVDGTAELLSLERAADGEDWLLRLRLDSGLEEQVVSKGSITVEGISLTVAKLDGRDVEIAIIPHTHEVTTLKTLSPGAQLNIETDVLAKYAQKREQSGKSYTVEELIALGF
jgi:riboflavin synthase